MRKPFVAGNWKMHGTRASVAVLLNDLKMSGNTPIDMAVFPPFVYLDQTQQILSGTNLAWGAQNVCANAEGAFTGEVSANMLTEFGCRYVLIGHSERRSLYHEDDALLAKKFMTAKAAGLIPVFCVGETLQEREAGETLRVIKRQLALVLALAPEAKALSESIIAYEPVWAIGTGKTATGEQAQAVHREIRQHIAGHNSAIAEAVRIIYGGSVKANNARELFAMPDIDGGLIGGASLNSQEFIAICKAVKDI